MRTRQKGDPLVTDIEHALNRGQFIPYKRTGGFVSGLDRLKTRIDALTDEGDPERAIRLYGLFLSGVYEKAEEIDPSGGELGAFFEGLFVSWITARQKAGRPAEETVRQILGWMKNDNFGFCFDIEGEVTRALDKEGTALFRGHFQGLFEKAFAPFRSEAPRRIHDYPVEVRLSAYALKSIYIAESDAHSYASLCELILISPRDCQRLANICQTKQRFAEALEWVERGLSIEHDRQWGNESSASLTFMRRELLDRVGRSKEAFLMTLEQFERRPSEYAYADLMKRVAKEDRDYWRNRAMETAKRTSLSGFIEICAGAKEWDALARHIDTVTREDLESVSHGVTEKVAKGLARSHASAAAKVYAALGMRIVKAGKSKRYRHALDHLRSAKRLADEAGDTDMWSSLVDEVRGNHSRKQGFMPGFEDVAAGRRPASESFEETASKRWKEQASQ